MSLKWSAKSSGFSANTERRNFRRVVVAVALLALAALGSARADEAADADTGLAVSFAYTGDLRRNTTGGLATGTAYSDLLDLGATWTSDKLFSDTRLTTNLSVMHVGGDEISSELVGDLHGVNNIEAPDAWHLYEFWSEFSFGGRGNTSLRLGMLDINADFDTPVTSGLFVGSPHGIGTEFSQTGGNGPSVWPVTGLGIRVAGEWSDALRWRFGAFEGAPGDDDETRFAVFDLAGGEGSLLIGELEYASERVNKMSLGLWSYTAAFERLDSGATAGNRGAYALVDLPLANIGAAEVDGSLRVGVADARFNAVDRFAGASVVVSHAFAARPGDALGFAVAYGRTGDLYRAVQSLAGVPAARAETSFELTYLSPITSWLMLAPSVQFVSNPGADLAMRDAWVVGLRFELSHEKAWPMFAQRAAQPAPAVARTDE
ncbi:MAG TPA: carbohydrate porin [Steroidobacteraceae bacterium]|nr:carbohydrate porin [Steroidobacteraceae bacterium]